MTTASLTRQFVRDELCWLCYLMIGNYCYIAAGLGPAMTFLRAEHTLSYSTVALHFSSWSLGVLCAGMLGERVMRRFGKPATVWTAGTAVCAGLLIFLSGVHPAVTIFGTLICGFNGSLMCQSLATIMANKFGELRVIAISESNLVASVFCSMSPLLISLCMKCGLNWRVALVLPVLMFLIFASVGKRIVAPYTETSEGKKSSHEKLPSFYWLCWLLVLFAVASEWSIIYWGADFLEKVGKIGKADAAGFLSCFLLAMVAGRLLGSRLVRIHPTESLLKVACVIAVIGFSIFWLGHTVILNVAGLAIAGLGIANFYPLTLSAAIGSAPEQAGTATARMSVASGGATLLSPLLLGLLAEHTNIFAAYGLVAVLLAVCCAIVFLSDWSVIKRPS